MMPIKKNAILAAIVILVIGFFSFFTVNEGESALILRLGKIVGSGKDQPTIQNPGLHFKIPFIDHVRYFDMRMQELATPVSHPLTVVTKEQTYLEVEYFAKWRITNLTKFYTSTGGAVSWAETLLEQRINDIVRAEYGRRTSIQAISTDRANMMLAIREQADTIGKDQGVSVIDVRIQQITLPKDVMDSVFKRMATERKQFAEAKRAGGVEKSEEIRALADQDVTVIKAKALMQAATIRAKGDQQAAEIYAKAYGSDPTFYTFYRSLEAYENSFRDKNDILVLKPEGRFFNYFHGGSNNTANITKK
ncbi:MAG: hflC [Gammaproteobacteria bacterium]|jgi:membrane protease subunit HflC|nr:hflC [Gammaproteobacteria bacterium]